jgi:hypothetical protein
MCCDGNKVTFCVRTTSNDLFSFDSVLSIILYTIYKKLETL